ncbi:MAG TPA: hypothetical protein VHQ87_01660, partial [Rhizobacter sp.]|nr:hypothetical protein [Rhizobacter sp.]
MAPPGAQNYAQAGQQAAAGAPTTNAPRPATVLTEREAAVANQWLTSADARAFFTAHQDQTAAFKADPAKWVKQVLIPGKAQGLYGTPDPLVQAQRLQQANPKPGMMEQIGQGIVNATGASMGLPVSTNVPDDAANRARATKIVQTQKALGHELGRTAGLLTRDARQAVAEGN